MKSKIDRLNDALGKGKYGKFHQWMYDNIFGLIGGTTANMDTGIWASNKYAYWIIKRRYKPRKETK